MRLLRSNDLALCVNHFVGEVLFWFYVCDGLEATAAEREELHWTLPDVPHDVSGHVRLTLSASLHDKDTVRFALRVTSSEGALLEYARADVARKFTKKNTIISRQRKWTAKLLRMLLELGVSVDKSTFTKSYLALSPPPP